MSFQPEFLCTILPVKQNSTNGTGYCKCVSGYWGASCQKECPGGASNPCYGKGLCDPVSGSCTCFTGVNSTENCQTCDENWIGTDCSVATTDKGKHVDVTQINSSFQYAFCFSIISYFTVCYFYFIFAEDRKL